MTAEATNERRSFLRKIIALGGLALPISVKAQQSNPGSSTAPSGGGKIFAGIRGRVVAIDSATGNIIWSTDLTGRDFVNVVLVGGDIYASTRGELFCVDPGTGQIRWRNRLKGYGQGIMGIAAPDVPANQVALMRARKHEEEKRAAATTVTTN